LAAAVERTHAVLLRPPSRGRWAIPIVVVAGVLGAAYAFWPSARQGNITRLVSPTGTIAVQQITRGGSAWQLPAEFEKTITAGGVEWALDPGDYVVRTADGVEVPFSVPRDRSVLIPGPRTDYSGELMNELDLEGLMDADRP
jgi:hypothetical protein